MVIEKDVRPTWQIDQQEECCSYSERRKSYWIVAASIISVFVYCPAFSQASRARHLTKNLNVGIVAIFISLTVSAYAKKSTSNENSETNTLVTKRECDAGFERPLVVLTFLMKRSVAAKRAHVATE
jgi:hypothetical protein